MYPPNYCSGDDHEYPGYKCDKCDAASSSQPTMTGQPISDTASVYQDEWWPAAVSPEQKKVDMQALGQILLDLEGELLPEKPATFLIEVDQWPKMYWSMHSKQYMWEALCKLTPDGVVRIPHQYYVCAESDGAKYYMRVEHNDEYLRHTRQMYVLKSAACSKEGI